MVSPKEWFMGLVKRGLTKRVQQPKYLGSGLVKISSSKDRNQIKESRLNDLSPEQRLMMGALKTENIREFSRGMAQLSSDLTTLFTNAIQDRRDYMEEAEELSRYPIASRILNILVNQINKANDRGEILDLVCERDDINDELKWLSKEHNLDNLLMTITKDVLLMGSYTMAIELSDTGEGVTAITDTVDQLGIVAFYDRGAPSGYLRWRKSDYFVEPPEKYCNFIIGQNRMRVALNDTLHRGYQIDYEDLPEDLKKKIPEYVRVGEPLFWNVVEKIRQLQILEQITIATKLAGITQVKLVTLNVPASMPVDKVMEACDKFENTLNNQAGVDTDMELVSVSEIMGQAGRYKVIPNYSDDKGSVAPLDVRHDPQVDDVLAAITDYREVLLTSIGIPYKLVFGSRNGNDSEGSRGEEVRVYAMFYDMIASMQRSIGEGIRQIALIHLINKGYKVKADEIQVIFKNASVNVGDLERAEYDDARQALIKNKVDFIQSLIDSEFINPALQYDGLMEWLEMSFNDLTEGIQIFKPTKTDDGSGNGYADPLMPLGPDQVNDPKLYFMNKVKDNFMKRRAERTGNPDLSVADSGEPAVNHDRKEDFMNRVKDNFQKKREHRNSGEEIPDGKDSSDNPRIDFLNNVHDNFLAARNENENEPVEEADKEIDG